MENLAYKTVHASVRPARVAVLIDRSDEDWQNTCLRIIEFYSQLWGGAYNIIIPTDGGSIDERFWTLLESFDPDYIYRYAKSVEDIRRSNPEHYEKLVEREVSGLLADPNDENEISRIRQEVDKELRNAWLGSVFAIGPQLQEEIKKRISPFWFEAYAVDAGAISAGTTPRWPLTKITGILPNTSHQNRIGILDVPADLVPELWYCAVSGRLSPDAVEAFEAVGVAGESFPFRDDNASQLIEFTVTGAIRAPRVFRPDKPVLYDLEGIAPYAITMLELGLYRSTRYPYWQEPLIIVAGNTLEDFCLYYSLSRLRDRVVWALPSITDKALAGNGDAELSRAETYFIFQLRTAARGHEHAGGISCLSYSLTSDQLDGVTNQLNRLGAGQYGPEVQKTSDIEELVRFPLTAVERDNFQRDISVLFADDLSVSPFSTPKPKHFTPIDPQEHRYITQLSVAGEAPPKHFDLGSQVIADRRLTTHEARVGKYGPAYFCPNIAYFGGDIDTVLVRPRLHLPPLHKIVDRLSRRHGYECRPSDKGIYAEDSISKWGGLEHLGAFLRVAENRALLSKFLDTSKSKSGDGVYLSDDRRYLDFTAVHSIVGERATELIDELITKQILYRGFVFGCSYCRNVAWFSVAEITQEFTCRRCGRREVYTKRHWKQPDEAAWFYKLDELIYQGYRHGMAVPVLALSYLKGKSEESFTYATEREFWKAGAAKPEMEADFICVPDGVFTIGEAKSGNTLGTGSADERARINKYKHVVKALAIRQLVFATNSTAWRSETVEAVGAAFAHLSHVRVIFLDASQLL